MPTKLKVLVALMGIAVLAALASQSWVSAGINALLLVGVLKGSEGVRTLLMLLAFVGLCWGGFLVVASVAAVAVGGLAGVLGLAAAVVNVAMNGYLLWCLRQQDVQAWMFARSSGGMA